VGGGKTRISQRTKANTEDTFGPVVKQLLRKLADAAEARLEAGHALRGQGRTLDSQGLSVGQRGVVRLSELARAGTFDQKVSHRRR
jgi:hypothetical protein